MVSEAAIIMTVCAKQGCLFDIPLLWYAKAGTARDTVMLNAAIRAAARRNVLFFFIVVISSDVYKRQAWTDLTVEVYL